ncbi:alpha/beta fold hydrolase [Hyphomonas sp.]|uniref:alpha/beta fold hydrolase n=1 Tax=Hyphomonas sp. TaxID=87 RepID=UPI0035276693
MALPQLILIPGRLNDEGLWRHQVDALRDVCRPMVADVTRGRSFAELAASVLSMAEDSFALAGFSFGGVVAMEMVRQAPERIARLALLDTVMMPDSAETLAARRKTADMAERSTRFHGFSDQLAGAYLSPQNRENADLVAEIRAMTERLGADVFARQTRLPRPDNREALAALACPVLIACGEEDVLTPPQSHRDIAALIPGSDLVMIPDAGHMTPLEQPEAVTLALRNWLTN